MPLLDASEGISKKTAITVFLGDDIIAEIKAYRTWRNIKTQGEFVTKAIQYVLKNDKDWRKIWMQVNQQNANDLPND